MTEVFADQKLILGIFFIPVGWLVLYSVFDKYSDIYRYSRMSTLIRTFWLSILGVSILFFTVLLDDRTIHYTAYVTPFFRLLFLHFGITAFIRMLFLTLAKQRLKAGKVSYNAIIIGGDDNAVNLYNEINERQDKLGLKFIGFVDSNGESENKLQDQLPLSGKLKICIDSSKKNLLKKSSLLLSELITVN